MDCYVGGGQYFLYYSYRRNPTRREFFVPAGTIVVKLFKEFTPNSLVLKIPTEIPTNQYQYGINTNTGQAASIKMVK